jgi:hypothetical protein
MAIVLEYKLTGIELLTRMQVVNAMKAALRATGEYWHEAFAWKRFTPLGFTEYGFEPRSRKYNEAKLLHYGHTNPLVATGEGREEALSESTKSRIRVTRDSVTIPLPTKFNLYNPKGPNMADEVRAVSKQELSILEENLVINIERDAVRRLNVR